MALNEAELEIVKTRWTIVGDSAGMIANGLGVTRNVVIGVIHRRGWLQAGGGTTTQRQRAPSQPRPQTVRPPAPPPPKKIELVLDPTKFVAFDQLGPHHCRYPVDAGGKDGLYCGLVPNGTPYCEGHAEKVYQPHQPRKIKRPRE